MARILNALNGTYPQCTGLQLATGGADISPCADGLGILPEDAKRHYLTSCQIGLLPISSNMPLTLAATYATAIDAMVLRQGTKRSNPRTLKELVLSTYAVNYTEADIT